MRIYNYLFYKTYLVAKKLRNFKDCPEFGGILIVMACVMMNTFAIFLFIRGLGIDPVIDYAFRPEYKVPVGIVFAASVSFFYYYKGRYKKIVAYYEKKEEEGMVKIHPAIVIILWYITSVFLMFLAGFFKNKDWIFAP